MASGDLYVDAQKANILAAQTFYNLFVMNLYLRGWMPALHGSTLADASPSAECRDIDFILVPVNSVSEERVLEVDQLKQWLIDRMMFDLRVEEERGDLLGWVGLMHGYVIDLTVVKR